MFYICVIIWRTNSTIRRRLVYTVIATEMDCRTADHQPGWGCPSTWEADAGRSLPIWGLPTKALSQKPPSRARKQKQKELQIVIWGKKMKSSHLCIKWERSAAITGKIPISVPELQTHSFTIAQGSLPVNQLPLSSFVSVWRGAVCEWEAAICLQWGGTGRLGLWKRVNLELIVMMVLIMMVSLPPLVVSMSKFCVKPQSHPQVLASWEHRWPHASRWWAEVGIWGQKSSRKEFSFSVFWGDLLSVYMDYVCPQTKK